MTLSTSSSKGSVLVIDDDEDSRVIYSIVLEHEGYVVITAGLGEEGLECARRDRPSVILLDIGLPDVDGLEVMRRLQATPAKDTPVIAISGRVMSHQQDEMRRGGFCQVLLKPVTPRVVIKAVDDALRS